MAIIGLWAFFFGDRDDSDGSSNDNSAIFRNGAAADADGRVTLDGVNDYVEIADAPQYALSEGTIHATYTLGAGSLDGTRSTNINDTSMQTLVSRDSSGYDSGGHLTIYVDGDGSLWIRHQSDTRDYTIRTDARVVQEGQEFDLVYSFSDTGGMTAWIDGVKVGSNTQSVANGDSIALSQNNEPWTLGASQTTSGDGVANSMHQFLDGKVGHFEIYDEALPPSELNTLHDLSDGVDDGVIEGTSGDDTIYGGNTIGEADGGAHTNDSISAGDGNDTIFAGDGDDRIDAGRGDDTVEAGSGSDKVYAGDGNDTVDGGSGDDIIRGGGGDDTLSGGEGHDTLSGGAGNDDIDGGSGNDVLTGGEGNDRFHVSRGDDTITDFNFGNTGAVGDGDSSNNDFLDLSRFYDSLDELRADQADDGVLNQSNTLDDEGKAVDYSDNTRFGTSSMTVRNADSSSYTYDSTGIVCFTEGTGILTPRGEVPIETLRVGDAVCTIDNGLQPIAWIGTRSVVREELVAHVGLRPVVIKKGVMGATRDLLVSRQHGILIDRDHFARATHLADAIPGVRIAHGKRKVTYIHLMFEKHQVIFSNGVPSESFFPGPQAVGMMGADPLLRLRKTFPSLPNIRSIEDAERSYGCLARQFAKKKQVSQHFIPPALIQAGASRTMRQTALH